ncbi:MAG: hypothetical protein ABSE07_06220 [Methanoregula sp.]|jgi:hypothetical protein
MKESLRRAILFTVIVIAGSVMILFDVPLILLIPLIVAAGFIILVLLGAITRADIRSVFSKKISQKPKKAGIIQRLNEMKFFEKKPAQTAQQDKKTVTPQKKEEPRKSIAIKTGAGAHLRSFLSSLGSLGTILKERSKHGKKVEHINQLLDKTVSEKVKDSAFASAGRGAGSIIPPPGSGGGPGLRVQGKDQDPFLSLSADEFDVSLLDGLDEQEALPSSQPSPSDPGPAPAAPEVGPALTIPEPDIPMPSLDVSSEADDILKDNAGDLKEFSGLEGGESIDQDFEDLDNLNLDDVNLDVDLESEAPTAGGSSPSAVKSTEPLPSGAGPLTVKTDWIPSDAPKGADIAENQISTQADMASFAGGASGTDEDLLSSLASDVKHVKKERNLSLLRDLKDFKAPATEIENELKETDKRLKTPRIRKEKGIPPAKGMK